MRFSVIRLLASTIKILVNKSSIQGTWQSVKAYIFALHADFLTCILKNDMSHCVTVETWSMSNVDNIMHAKNWHLGAISY